jgi:hypothetical protein
MVQLVAHARKNRRESSWPTMETTQEVYAFFRFNEIAGI